jgi:serine/threonine protein kinase
LPAASPAVGDGTELMDAVQQAQAAEKSKHSHDEIDLPVSDPTESLPSSARLPVPPTVPGYEVIEFLGMGSFGHVWKVRESSTGKVLALKCFEHGTREGWQALLKEVCQLALLDGVRGVVDLKDVGHDHNPPYYVMAFAEGGSLAARLQKQDRLPAREALRLFEQAAAALAYVHAKGVRHCDLKPGNLLLDVRDNVLVADFGQAHLGTDASPALGTLFYMAPEQATLEHQMPDTRWDVYALGAVFYRMVTGRAPRHDSSTEKVLKELPDTASRLTCYRQCIADAPRPQDHRRAPGVDRDLALIVDRCLEADPARRLRDAGAILDALKRRREWRRQRPALLSGLVGTLAALVITALAGLWSKTDAVNVYREGLTHQQLVSNRQSARLVANAVEQGLDKRIRWLEHAARRRLYEATATDDRLALDQVLRDVLTSKGEPTDLFAEATVANRKGELLAQVRLEPSGPEDAPFLRSIDPADYPHRQFSWRDWFNGQGDHRPGSVLPPITQTHISAPYVSTDREAPRMFISLSVPIRDPDRPNGPVVGVVEGAVLLTQMNAWLNEANIDTDGFAVLFDARGHCMLHRDADFAPTAEHGPRRFLSPAEQARLFDEREGEIEEHIDPVDGRAYLASYARMSPRIGWVAVVQHDREQAIAPIEQLRARLTTIGLLTFGLVACLISGLWAWLFWMLRRAEQLGEGG